MRYQFHTNLWIPAALEPVFLFFSNPNNIPRLTHPQQHLRLEAISFTAPPWSPKPPRSLVAGVGSKVTLSFRPIPHFFMRFFWDVEIIDFVWNDHYVDRQIRGPFASWVHTHSFASETRGDVEGTWIIDDIEYELPAGIVGEKMQPLIHKQLAAMFEYRHERLREGIKKKG